MDEQQVELIRRSWSRMEANQTGLAERFYDRLFQLDPSLRDLFTVTDMGVQNEKFVAMMQEIVDTVHDPERLLPMVADSGRRHRDYGVRASDYHTVGEAFLWAVEKGMPEPFDQETQGAWAAAYSLLASVMRHAAPA